MLIEFEAKLLKVKVSYNTQLQIQLTINEQYVLQTQHVAQKQGIYGYLEYLSFKSEEQNLTYISFRITNNTNDQIAYKTQFFDDVIKKDTLILHDSNGNALILTYQLKAHNIQHPKHLAIKHKKSLQTEHDSIQTQEGKLELFKMGLLMFNFSQRLGPLVSLKHEITAILQWKNPTKTIITGVILTIIMTHPQLCLLVSSFIIFFSKHRIYVLIKTYQNRQLYSGLKILPKDNLLFLQDGMEDYCQVHERTNQFLIRDDKTYVINMIQLFCKLIIVFCILMFLIGIQKMAILTLWLVLLFGSKSGLKILKGFTPTLLELDKRSNLLMNTVTKNILKKNDIKGIQKKFYYYHYERWWLGREWVDCNEKTYSDQTGKATIIPRKDAPSGWKWKNNWSVDFSGNVDAYGYQYSNDFVREYRSDINLKVLRRIKMYRICVPNLQSKIGKQNKVLNSREKLE